MKRTGFKRKPPKPRPPEGPLGPGQWFTQALERAHYRSELTGDKVVLSYGPPIDATAEVHHVVSKRWLRANGYHQLVWHLDNAMVLRHDEHAHHEDGSHRIGFDQLPDRAVAFAAAIGEPALVAVERHHPRREETHGSP